MVMVVVVSATAAALLCFLYASQRGRAPYQVVGHEREEGEWVADSAGLASRLPCARSSNNDAAAEGKAAAPPPLVVVIAVVVAIAAAVVAAVSMVVAAAVVIVVVVVVVVVVVAATVAPTPVEIPASVVGEAETAAATTPTLPL